MANNESDPMDQDLDTAGLDNTPGTGTGMNAAQSMSGGTRDWSKTEGQAGSDYLHGAENDSSREGVGADPDETRRLAQEATERLREDYDNRGVSGNGNF